MEKDKGLLREKRKVAQAVDKFLKLWTTSKTGKAVCAGATNRMRSLSAACRLRRSLARERVRCCVVCSSLAFDLF